MYPDFKPPTSTTVQVATILSHTDNDADQSLADKYAPGDVEIASTLAKLQLPQDLQPSTPDRAGFVPLPPRAQTLSKQQTAVAIRDGRKAAQRIVELNGKYLFPATSSKSATFSGKSVSGTSSSLKYSARRTSLSTVLEQDFTVPGKKGPLQCPYSRPAGADIEDTMETLPRMTNETHPDHPSSPINIKDTTPHQSADPICAALYAETASAPPSASGSAAKCPIRYLDQHSPEEVAAYFETHKHEIPRSHEVCVRRYQRNEADIRKLDAKYGSLVHMIQGLGEKHQPMLTTKEDEEESLAMENSSNERVESWAQAVSADGNDNSPAEVPAEVDYDRESRFDRPLKEVRVGESPSRPWGISVPVFDSPNDERPRSRSPAPISASHNPKTSGKCPLGHGTRPEEKPAPPVEDQRPKGKCPFGHGGARVEKELPSSVVEQDVGLGLDADPHPSGEKIEKQTAEPTLHHRPTFIQTPDTKLENAAQIIFNGPVFIGYPIEDAMAYMKQFKEM